MQKGNNSSPSRYHGGIQQRTLAPVKRAPTCSIDDTQPESMVIWAGERPSWHPRSLKLEGTGRQFLVVFIQILDAQLRPLQEMTRAGGSLAACRGRWRARLHRGFGLPATPPPGRGWSGRPPPLIGFLCGCPPFYGQCREPWWTCPCGWTGDLPGIFVGHGSSHLHNAA